MRLMLMMRILGLAPPVCTFENWGGTHDFGKFGAWNAADDAQFRVGVISRFSCKLGRNCFPNA